MIPSRKSTHSSVQDGRKLNKDIVYKAAKPEKMIISLMMAADFICGLSLAAPNFGNLYTPSRVNGSDLPLERIQA